MPENEDKTSEDLNQPNDLTPPAPKPEDESGEEGTPAPPVEPPAAAPPPPQDTSPNVIFVGTRKRNGKEERLEEAPARLIDGPKVFDDLPSSEVQLKGFYYERAAELCRAFPGLYKKFVNKGE